MDKYIGKKLDGRYEITELIGVGGMAEVYKGVDVIDNKAVAIKILKKEYAENEEFLRRFRNESKAIAVLSHPNIVKIYDVGFSEKIQYIVMEYIDGITLKEYIEEEKVLTWKDTVHFVIQILRALQHAHDKGIVHRDIKPQNIMMFNDGTIKVMDFGIAKFAREEGKTATDQAIGSVHYISPEQASGAVTDAKSDIYSVGAMMYEMLTGKKPFDSDNPVAIAVMHMHDIPERPRAINPDVPDGLEEIVLRAMEKDPDDRYQTTAEMISDIEKFKNDPKMTFGYYEEETEETEDVRYFDQQKAPEAQAPQQNYQAQPQPAYAGAGAGYMADQQYGGGQPPQQQAYGNVYNNDDYYEDEEEEEEEERGSLVVPVLTAVVVVVIIVAVIFIATLLSGLLKGGDKRSKLEMPDVVGMDFNDAVNMWGTNLQFQEDGQEYNPAEPGTIISQSIEAGAEFRKGDVVKVKISKGQETVEVPNCVNMNQEIAKDQLRKRGLEVEVRNSSSAEVQKGYVISSEPEAGTTVHKGQTILLYVSMGAEAGQVKVDDYVKMSVDDAVTMAEYKGLKPKTELVASYEDEGKVVKQSIDKGEKVEIGTEIVFQVSNGKKPDGVIAFTVPFPAEANGRFAIDFILRDEEGKVKPVSSGNFICPEMSSITTDIEGSGEHVSVQAMLTNLNNNARAQIGSYTFNFATQSYSSDGNEDIWGAFSQVGGFNIPTEAPQEVVETPTDAPVVEAPTEWVDPNPQPTQDPITGQTPVPGANGQWVDNVWVWYQPGVNGFWNDQGLWEWNEQ